MLDKRFISKFKTKVGKIDKTLIFITYLLTVISTLFIYSSTRNMHYVKQNILWICVGTLFMIITTFVDYRVTKALIKYIYLMSLLILIYTRFFGVVKLGARRWIKLVFIQIQPSEFVKILLIMIFAYWICRQFQNGINNLKDIIIAFLPGTPIIGLLLLQPDLGVSLILCFSFLCMLILSNANLRPLIMIGITVIALSFPVYTFVLKDYQKTRIEVFLNPEKDIQNKGWHVTQSKISIGSGKLFGRGYLNGSQSKLKFLPEPQTDFIFSVIGEEIGFVGASFVLMIYFYLIFKIISISKRISEDYGRYILYGISGIFLAHIVVNVGMTVGLVPVTGKPLLLMSYGGSSFLSSFIMIGLVLSIKVNDGEKDE